MQSTNPIPSILFKTKTGLGGDQIRRDIFGADFWSSALVMLAGTTQVMNAISQFVTTTN